MVSGLHGAGTVDAASLVGEALNTGAGSATIRLQQTVEQAVLDQTDDRGDVIHTLVKVSCYRTKIVLSKLYMSFL